MREYTLVLSEFQEGAAMTLWGMDDPNGQLKSQALASIQLPDFDMHAGSSTTVKYIAKWLIELATEWEQMGADRRIMEMFF